MKLSRFVQKCQELSLAIGVRNASILMLAHLLRKAPWRIGRKPLVVHSGLCSQPVRLRPGTSDVDVFRQIFISEEYAPCSRLDGIRTIVDCGANIGLASMYLLDSYPLAKVLAIEPDPGNAEICRRNLRSFGDRAQVESFGVWASGDWEKPARLRFDRYAGDGREWAIAVREARADEAAESTGIAMRAICDRVGHIDLLKVDIEGAEALIFSDDSAPWLSRVSNIAIELHNDSCRRSFEGALANFAFETLKSRESVFVTNLEPKVAASWA
jgi:FkbM family methyltransferase